MLFSSDLTSYHPEFAFLSLLAWRLEKTSHSTLSDIITYCIFSIRLFQLFTEELLNIQKQDVFYSILWKLCLTHRLYCVLHQCSNVTLYWFWKGSSLSCQGVRGQRSRSVRKHNEAGPDACDFCWGKTQMFPFWLQVPGALAYQSKVIFEFPCSEVCSQLDRHEWCWS